MPAPAVKLPVATGGESSRGAELAAGAGARRGFPVRVGRCTAAGATADPDDGVVDETAEWHEGFCPAILCVDCNAVPDSDEVRRLTGKSAPSCLFSHH